MAVMTKTEVLLIILGGIFVIEALSVLIQVFSFQTFRKRVFLMAPIHHHFELQGLVGDEDHPALLDRRRGLQRDRLHAVPAVGDLTVARALARRVSTFRGQTRVTRHAGFDRRRMCRPSSALRRERADFVPIHAHRALRGSLAPSVERQ